MKVAIICCDEVDPLLTHLGYIFDHRKENFHLYLADADAFIIQATVLVDTEKHTNWEGLKLIERLRQEFRCQQPILLTSWRDDLLLGMQVCKSIERLPERRVFLDPLVKFVPLSKIIPSTLNSLTTFFDPPLYQPADCMSFDELVRIVYEHPPTYVRELFHRLYSRMEKEVKAFRSEPAIDLVFDELIQLQQILQNRQIDVIKHLEKFRADAGQTQEKVAFYRLLMQLYDQLSANISEGQESKSEMSQPEAQHLLFVDDMAEDKERLSKLLAPYHIIVHPASDLSTAESCMSNYPAICAVLCDFRLYDRYGRIARQQGSQIMRVLREKHPNLYFGYLSSYQFGKQDIRPSAGVELFHKHSIFSGEQPEFGRFIQRIFQKAEEKRSEMRYISPALRQKSIGNYYLKFRHADEFRAMIREIDNLAIDIITDFQNGLFRKAGFGHRFQTNFIDKEGSEQYNLEKLRLRLLCRRVIIGLLQLPEYHFDRKLKPNCSAKEKRQVRFNTIYDFLLGDYVKKDTQYKSKQDILNNCLGIKTGKTYLLSQFPQQTRELVFPEEWVWLQINSHFFIDRL